MADEQRLLSLQETEEFSGELDAIVKRHSREVILPVLSGMFDGIAKNPRAFGRTSWNTRIAKSDPLGLTVPTFSIIFQLQNEGEKDEYVLLLWIRENDPTDDVMKVQE
jgi:hypothetical protein